MDRVLEFLIANWGVIAAGGLIVLRFVECGVKTGKWDIVSLIKEFCVIG